MATISEINMKSSAFWAIETERMLERMADEALRDTALETINAELIKATPIRFQTTLEFALFDAEKKRDRFSTNFAQRGGKAKKPDALQQLIEAIVRENPSITLKLLLKKIKAQEYEGVIDEVTDDEISFSNYNGRLKSAPLSALKHRLSRARKKNQRFVVSPSGSRDSAA